MVISSTPAKPSNLSRRSVESVAESISEKFGYAPHWRLAQIVSCFGGKISAKDFSESPEDGSIFIKSDGDFEIFLPTHTSPLRDRFTVAHELGHYVLHYLWAKRTNPNLGAVHATRYGSDRAEWEANWFASAFLMPSEEVKQFWNNESTSLADVAGHFSVSTSAAAIRLKRLGLLPVEHEQHEDLTN